MELPTLLEQLGYSASRNFLKRTSREFKRAEDVGHIFRAAGKGCRLAGVYTLRPPASAEGSRVGAESFVPVVYVCTASNEAMANEIHRLVWNQDIVPFLLVHTPKGLLLYSGFERTPKDSSHTGLLQQLIEFNELHDRLSEFHAQAIDSGELWQRRSAQIKPEARVYWSLLNSLKELAAKLRGEHGLDKTTIHPLIGKYVYLHYLKDRGFLSPRRFADWKIDPASVFGRTATFAGLRAVCGKLDEFLNGRVFPIKFRGRFAPNEEQVQRVAGAFAGDVFEGGWQFHLPFDAYNFAYIPIETLSLIYEQFLHTPNDGPVDEDNADESVGDTEGRKAGAYYTPIPVVSFMLAELDEHRRLERGVRVWDPSCGSGAFLVQCYRRLIERTFLYHRKLPKPSDLASLLKRHIFGVDMDEDACSVTEFSLYLTLLDYVQPSDLVDYPQFRLPTLRGKNIFCRDFFSVQPFAKARFHWIAGNPPWKQLKTGRLEKRDERAMQWIKANTVESPVGMYSLSQAFAWRCREFLHRDGVCALLLPAMTLFEDPSQDFRKVFFRQHRVHSVANFSNLAENLFAGRARVPAAAFCFGLRQKNSSPDDLERTRVYSPLVANQEATRPIKARVRNETWSLVVNGDEVRDLPFCEIASGSGLPWKLATWGSTLDQSLLDRLRNEFVLLEECEAKWHPGKKDFIKNDPKQLLKLSQGLELRSHDASDKVDRIPTVAGKHSVNVNALNRYRRVFHFPSFALSPLPNGQEYARRGRIELPLAVCYPPHVIVSAARNFSVFSDEFIIVPPRQIGIASLEENTLLLKAIAIYLSSDFAFYHQFLVSPQFGVQRGRATLDALRKIPMPLVNLSKADLNQWANLHDRLAKTTAHVMGEQDQDKTDLGQKPTIDRQDEMIRELNELVFAELRLDELERALIEDLVSVRLSLNDGKLGKAAMAPTPANELTTYAEWLRRELDAQSDEEKPCYHAVSILHDDRSGFVVIESKKSRIASESVNVTHVGREDAATLTRTRNALRKEAGQWVYFDRSLRIYHPNKTYLFKPINRMHWTRSRAVLDAADLQIGAFDYPRNA